MKIILKVRAWRSQLLVITYCSTLPLSRIQDSYGQHWKKCEASGDAIRFRQNLYIICTCTVLAIELTSAACQTRQRIMISIFNILPTTEDYGQLKHNLSILLARTRPPFLFWEEFQGVVEKHIPRPYSSEMSLKSEVVSIPNN